MLLIKKRNKYDWSKCLANNTVEIPNALKSCVKLRIDGLHNTIIIKTEPKYINGRLDISIYGNNNTIYIDNAVSVNGFMSILLGNKHSNFTAINDSKFVIGSGTSIEYMSYSTFNSGAYCNIGKNCMIGHDVTILNTDAHPVFDINSHRIVNFVHGIIIGDHVWLGSKSSILKNTIVADDCIVGYGAVVSGKFATSHCAIAGNPAKIVKCGITWDSYSHEYCANNHEGQD